MSRCRNGSRRSANRTQRSSTTETVWYWIVATGPLQSEKYRQPMGRAGRRWLSALRRTGQRIRRLLFRSSPIQSGTSAALIQKYARYEGALGGVGTEGVNGSE